jgi:hypothetical protein
MSEEARRDAKYRRHEIRVEAHERRPGCWGWSYLIDGRIAGASRRSLLLDDAEKALRQGLAAAQARVDGMEGEK